MDSGGNLGGGSESVDKILFARSEALWSEVDRGFSRVWLAKNGLLRYLFGVSLIGGIVDPLDPDILEEQAELEAEPRGGL